MYTCVSMAWVVEWWRRRWSHLKSFVLDSKASSSSSPASSSSLWSCELVCKLSLASSFSVCVCVRVHWHFCSGEKLKRMKETFSLQSSNTTWMSLIFFTLEKTFSKMREQMPHHSPPKRGVRESFCVFLYLCVYVSPCVCPLREKRIFRANLLQVTRVKAESVAFRFSLFPNSTPPPPALVLLGMLLLTLLSVDLLCYTGSSYWSFTPSTQSDTTAIGTKSHHLNWRGCFSSAFTKNVGFKSQS